MVRRSTLSRAPPARRFAGREAAVDAAGPRVVFLARARCFLRMGVLAPHASPRLPALLAAAPRTARPRGHIQRLTLPLPPHSQQTAYRRAAATARRDSQAGVHAGLTEEQKQEIR